MMDAPARQSRTLSVLAAGLLAVVVFFIVLAGLCRSWLSLVSAVATVGLELAAALAIFGAAAAFGHLLTGRLTKSAPLPLVLLTALGVGLYAMSILVLLAGTISNPDIPLLSGGIWWPVIAVGLLLGLWQIQPTWRRWTWNTPRANCWQLLAWGVFAAVLAVWLSGASQPPGMMGQATGDVYDVLEYHLQVGREFYNARHIGALNHNCYSFYPLGVEMLYLLGMILRGGPYDGMYLPAFIHGLFGATAVAAIYLSLGKTTNPNAIGQTKTNTPQPTGRLRATLSALLLASVPGLIYLSYLAQTELAQVFYLALAILWLRHWLAQPTWQAAVCIGLLIGAACATKYLAIAFVALPVLGAMTIFSLRRRLLTHVAIAGVLCILLAGPWLVRNVICTGNPVFPLATPVLGRGYWTAQQEQRWLNAHGWQDQPPVPQPASWQKPQTTWWGKYFTKNLLGQPQMSPPVVLLAGIAMLVLLVSRSRNRWEWALCIIVVIQLCLWPFTHQLPWRFVSPATVPLALLAGWLLERLWFLRRWLIGPAIVVVILISTIGFNLICAWRIFTHETSAGYMLAWSGEQIAGESWPWSLTAKLPTDSKVLLLGNATAFYFPSKSVYATAFDDQLLGQLIQEHLSPEDILTRLKQRGITHIYVDWSEIFRLSCTYGFPASLSEDLFTCRENHSQPKLKFLDQLRGLGMRELPVEGNIPDHRFVPTASWDARPMPISWPKVSLFALP